MRIHVQRHTPRMMYVWLVWPARKPGKAMGKARPEVALQPPRVARHAYALKQLTCCLADSDPGADWAPPDPHIALPICNGGAVVSATTRRMHHASTE